MDFHLAFGEDLSINFHFLGKAQQHYRDVIHLMGLNRGSAATQNEVYLMDLPDGERISDVLSFLDETCGLCYSSKKWIRHNLRYGFVWECETDSVWVICSSFEPNNFKEGDPKGLRIWTSLMIGFPTIIVAQQHGGFFLHAALVSHHGRGLVISAKGGMGKTTTCHRLPEPWRVHADDQVLIIPQKNGDLMAYALPTWSIFWDEEPVFPVNIREPIPLKAFVFLNQAKQNTLTPLTKVQAVSSLFMGVVHMSRLYWRFMEKTRKQAWANKIISRCRRITETFPAWHLELSLTGAFWNDLERLL